MLFRMWWRRWSLYNFAFLIEVTSHEVLTAPLFILTETIVLPWGWFRAPFLRLSIIDTTPSLFSVLSRTHQLCARFSFSSNFMSLSKFLLPLHYLSRDLGEGHYPWTKSLKTIHEALCALPLLNILFSHSEPLFQFRHKHVLSHNQPYCQRAVVTWILTRPFAGAKKAPEVVFTTTWTDAISFKCRTCPHRLLN